MIFEMINKSFKKFFILFCLIFFSYSNAYSSCKHLVKFGKKFTPKLAKEHGERPQGFSELYFEANDICPGQNLNGIVIKYSFINDILGSIHMYADNEPGKNKTTEALTLMKYTKKVYGDFDTGADPKIYNHFYSWQKKKKYIIYRRLKTEENLWVEDLTISNSEYTQILNSLINEDRNEPIIVEAQN